VCMKEGRVCVCVSAYERGGGYVCVCTKEGEDACECMWESERVCVCACDFIFLLHECALSICLYESAYYVYSCWRVSN
jgi:hypothetical protein